jgi:hypothetical protein
MGTSPPSAAVNGWTGGPYMNGPTILIVADNRVLGTVLRPRLRRMGVRIATSAAGAGEADRCPIVQSQGATTERRELGGVRGPVPAAAIGPLFPLGGHREEHRPSAAQPPRTPSPVKPPESPASQLKSTIGDGPRVTDAVA